MQLVGRRGRRSRASAPQPQGVDQAAADQGAQAEPQAVAAGRRFAVRVRWPSVSPSSGRSGRPALRSVLEHELGRVQQGPQQVFGRRAAVALRARRTAPRRRSSPRRSGTGRTPAGTVPRRSARGRLVALGERGDAAVVAGDLARAAPGAFIRCSAWTTVVSLGPLAGRVLVRVGPAEGVEEQRGRRGGSRSPSRRVPRRRGRRTCSGTPVTSAIASSRTSARSRWR